MARTAYSIGITVVGDAWWRKRTEGRVVKDGERTVGYEVMHEKGGGRNDAHSSLSDPSSCGHLVGSHYRYTKYGEMFQAVSHVNVKYMQPVAPVPDSASSSDEGSLFAVSVDPVVVAQHEKWAVAAATFDEVKKLRDWKYSMDSISVAMAFV